MQAMTNFSNASLSPVEDGPHYNNTSNDSGTSSDNNYSIIPEQEVYIILIFTSCICIFGLVGNVIVIYLLGFHIQRSPFTTYILNLAVADFGVLLCGSLAAVSHLIGRGAFLLPMAALLAALCMYSISQLILTTISIDRCVSLLFPIWYRCHRPQHLSPIVCAIIWVLSCLFSGIIPIMYTYLHYGEEFFFYQFIAGAVVCLPLATISTMVLFFKVFCKSQQPRRGRILAILILTLLSFLIFTSPPSAMITLDYFSYFKYGSLGIYAFLCACLNSGVNPLIYYMVGRKKRGQERQGLKVILQRAFKEEEEPTEERGTTAQTQL